MLARMPFMPRPVAAGSSASASLPRDFICELPGGTRIGGNRVTVLSGEYVVHGSDSRGVFWRHSTRGIVRSGNLGRVEEGGIYCPFDPKDRCLMWIVPKDQGSLFLGAVTIVPQKAEPERFSIYVGDVPAESSTEMRTYFRDKKEPNHFSEPTPGAVH